MAYFIDFYFDLHIYDPLQSCLCKIKLVFWQNREAPGMLNILINCHLDARPRQIQLIVTDNWEVSLWMNLFGLELKEYTINQIIHQLIPKSLSPNCPPLRERCCIIMNGMPRINWRTNSQTCTIFKLCDIIFRYIAWILFGLYNCSFCDVLGLAERHDR